MSEKRYMLAPGLEIVPLGESRFLLRSDFAALRLSGETSSDFVQQVLSRLDPPLTAAGIIERMPGYKPAAVRAQLEHFLEEGILVTVPEVRPPNVPLAALLDELGLGAETTARQLAARRVTIFGLEAHGAYVAQMLAGLGVGTLMLVDPFAFEHGHISLTPVKDPSRVGSSRQSAVAQLLADSGVQVQTGGEEALTQERIGSLAAGSDLLLVCWDRGFSAAHHWANRAAIDQGIAALFADLRAASYYAGPFVYPGRSACFMCYRMRVLANEDDFDLSMAYEEHLDKKKEPSLARRPILPLLPSQLASTLSLEALKHLSGFQQPTLVDRVLEFDSFTSQSRVHRLATKPDCPVCSKKKRRDSPQLSVVLGDRRHPASPAELADRLVSPHCGIVTGMQAASREPSEPPRPLVWRARISNHKFLSERDDTHATCSGKGMSRAQALNSCLGEAVERYAGGCWLADELTLARQAELDGPALHPRELVLYRPDQYADIPYAPYRDQQLAWIKSRSLTGDGEVWVPAIAALMDYSVHSPEEFLFPITSNGLAAGATLGDAISRAICEVLERDALLITWLNRLPGRYYRASEHPDPEVRGLAVSYRRRGVRLALIELPTDHPVTVFMGVAIQEGGFGGPAATVGLGADMDPLQAARQAAMEVAQVRPALRQRARLHDAERVAELVADPALVSTLEDHALLYADPAMIGSFEFLFAEQGSWPAARSGEGGAELGTLISHFRAVGQEVLYVNLTPPDLEPLGLHAVRAILPGYQPIWFGRGERRLGGRRLYELPRQLGLRDQDTGVDSLNPLPHPLA